MAAYLDGMLSTEESNIVEELINSNPEMTEMQDAIDSVDTTCLYVTNDEIPIECLADDFSLPDIDYGDNNHAIVSYGLDEFSDFDSGDDGNQSDIYGIDYEEDSSDAELGDSFLGDGYNDI